MEAYEVKVLPKEGHFGEEVKAEADELLSEEFPSELEENILFIKVKNLPKGDQVRVALANMKTGVLVAAKEVFVFPKGGYTGEQVKMEVDQLLNANFVRILRGDIVRILVTAEADRQQVRTALVTLSSGELA